MTRLVAVAREQGASAAYLCLDDVGGLPLPASLVVAERPALDLAGLDPEHVAAELASQFGGRLVLLPSGPAAVSVSQGEDEFRARAQVVVPGSGRVLVLAFSTPLPQLAAAWERLFLAMLGTLRWRETGCGR